ncbi:glycoprotease family protein [Daldinia vernicosa]|uniref:glycoprotease family protein n=1 Tax=Daldinia vernicosa TaxID=114800 RepID=UPI0020086CD0|nr:glycoprotease family protein [Daldinia vernicosa]KAI0847595.1 glycoprotease family protein [Daldinia vernicosa]
MRAAWSVATQPRSLAPVLARLSPRPPAQGLSWHTTHHSAGSQRRRLLSSKPQPQPQPLLTLAIESSCDDTCVTVLEKDRGVVGRGAAARLLFDKKITSDNRQFRGVRPITAVASHTQHLAGMVREAMRAFPDVGPEGTGDGAVGEDDTVWVDGRPRRKPDFVTVTRGPGMMSNLSTGLNTAKGLAVAWGVPLLAVHHMQAHALTPRLVSALEAGKREREQDEPPSRDQTPEQAFLTPAFPFLSLLVSGGHSLLVLSRSLTNHSILAEAQNIAVGDMLDKCARDIVPASELAASSSSSGVMYAAHLERFAFPDGPSDYASSYVPPSARAQEIKIYDSGLGWKLTPPLSESLGMSFEFAGLNGQVIKVMMERPDMELAERRLLARHTMRLAFEHLASRLLLALSKSGVADEGEGEDSTLLRDVRTLVVAGGVASNRYLMHILRTILDVRGYSHIELVCPPLPLCTDNGAMIAWAGMEMYEAGWRSELDILAIKKWPLDPNSEDGGILGVPGWKNVEKTKS